MNPFQERIQLFEEPLRSCFLAVKSIAVWIAPELKEDLKYNMPCLTLDGKAFCYLWQDKHSPYLLLVDGQLIEHPALEQGDRRRMKILRFDPEKDIDVQLIEEVILAALDVRRSK